MAGLKHSDSMAKTVAAIMEAPRTRESIMECTGAYPDTVRLHLRALHTAGCIYCCGHTPDNSEIFAMQPTPFHHPDAQRPVGNRRKSAADIQPPATPSTWFSVLEKSG